MSASGQGGAQPLKSALKGDDAADRTPPGSGSIKAVQIADPEHPQSDDAYIKRQHSANLAKRLGGKHPAVASSSSRSSVSQASQASQGSPVNPTADSSPSHHHHHHYHHASQKLLAQVSEWLDRERTKASRQPKKTSASQRRKSPHKEAEASKDAEESKSRDPETPRSRAESIDSQSSEISFDRLQRIVEDSMVALGLNSIPRSSPRLGRSSSGRPRKSLRSLQLHRTVSSDTDYFDGEVTVPSCDAVLDNSKTMSYSAGKASTDDLSMSSKKEEKEQLAWSTFKNEVVRLAHTLKLKGWRQVPLEDGDRISIERLSGALTNAVYVVSPPSDLEVSPPDKKPPKKLLLRIYGSQVEQLIDRENELSVLRRLARKRIGPRLLGTFTNGRFEEFFNATTLVPANLREPETSKQIAKRMRELHDGIELLEEELDEGPGVWKNWDRWLANVEKRAAFLDAQVTSSSGRRASVGSWKSKGYVCGVEWPKFKAMVDQYRGYLDSVYSNPDDLRDSLVFAHNDTQYGNILRIRPDDEKSPLLHPANEHKQLVVIDFEYAAANVRGLEFANHFSEWGYNYHDETAPHSFNADLYPTPEQQHRFIKAYVDHRPQFPHASSSTPRLKPLDTPTSTAPALVSISSSSSIADFMLDARAPHGGWKEEERRREEQVEVRVAELMSEAKLWRAANSAQWVAWGIVQAKVSGLEGDPGKPCGGITDFEEAEIDGDEFDYLAYAQERAWFFWGDCVLLGLANLEDLPEGIRGRVKMVDR